MQVQINGNSFEVPDGSNISIINNILYVDGQEYTGDGYESKQFKIEIWGGVANIEVQNGDVSVNGNSGSIKAGGSVTVGRNSGSIDAKGSVKIGENVSGSVTAAGSVNCGFVGGDVKAGGSVKRL
jgi:hypothetical protein